MVMVDGLRMHLVEHPARSADGPVAPDGDAPLPVVVLVHGMYGSSIGWSPRFIDTLCANGMRVLAVDRPGHGWSERPRPCPPDVQARLLSRACAAAGADRPIVLGHSWGAAVALCWALDSPRGLAGVVSVAGYVMPSATHVPWLFKVPGAAALVSPLVMLAAPRLAARATGQRVASLHLRRSSRRAAAPRQLAANFDDFKIVSDAMLERVASYPSIDVPVEIVAGTDDRTLSTKHHSVELHERLPQSRLTLIAGGGHVLPETHPIEVAAAVMRVAQSRD